MVEEEGELIGAVDEVAEVTAEISEEDDDEVDEERFGSKCGGMTATRRLGFGSMEIVPDVGVRILIRLLTDEEEVEEEDKDDEATDDATDEEAEAMVRAEADDESSTTGRGGTTVDESG